MKKLIIVLVAVWATSLPGQVSAADDTAAKTAYKNGRELYKAGKYSEAIVELKKAYSLKPHPALLRYMGDTYFKLNDARQAIEHYKKYLKEAPEAPDKDKVEAKVRQLELVVGAGEEGEEDDTPPPPPQATEPATTPPATTEDSPSSIDLTPTGEDKEVPLALKKKNFSEPEQTQKPVDTGGGTSAVTVMKFVAAGVGVVGLALGIVFNRMAAGNADELETAVKTECPPADLNCGGNPDMNSPKIQFDKRHFELQQSYNRNQAVSIASFITGGVGAAAAVIMFVVDKPKRERRATVTPVIAEGYVGFAGEVTF